MKMSLKFNWVNYSFEHSEYYDAVILENPKLIARVFVRSWGKDENLIAVFNTDEVDMTYVFTHITVEKFGTLEEYLLYAESKIIGFLGNFLKKLINRIDELI